MAHALKTLVDTKMVDNPTTAAGLEWYALMVSSQREFAAAHGLEEAGVAVFCPTRTRWVRIRRPGRDRVERQFPLMPGYVFIGMDDPSQWAEARCVTHVRGRVGFDGVPSVIPTPQIQRLMDREASGEWRAPNRDRRAIGRFLSIGDIVTAESIKLPAAKGHSLEVEAVRGHKAILKGLGILGAQVIEVDMRRLEPVG